MKEKIEKILCCSLIYIIYTTAIIYGFFKTYERVDLIPCLCIFLSLFFILNIVIFKLLKGDF